jgi:VanZ family protein
MKKNLVNILFVVWSVLILFASIIPLSQEKHFEFGGSIFRLDYLEHFAVFFILGSLYVLRAKLRLKISEMSLLIIYATFTETIQMIIPGRTFNPMDLVYNILGFVFSLILINKIKNKVMVRNV